MNERLNEILYMAKTKIESLSPIPANFRVSKGEHNGFELLVVRTLRDLEISENFQIITHFGHHFPDLTLVIDSLSYGIEIKSRQDGSWGTNGNSVMESITTAEYESIYTFFGSYKRSDNKYLVKYKPYWLTTKSIKVTHSPRFTINMDDSNSVFENETEYKTLRSLTEEEKIVFLQSYFHEKINSPKWYVSTKTDTEVAPLRKLNNIQLETKKSIIAELLVVFPHDLIKRINGRTNSNYDRITAYLISTHYLYTTNMRDFFTSGGLFEYNNSDYPAIFGRLYVYKRYIVGILDQANEDFVEMCYEYWSEIYEINNNLSFKDNYFDILNYLGRNYFYDEIETLPNNNISSFLS